MKILGYIKLSNDRIAVKYETGKVKKHKIYHETSKGILCDDFETYIIKGVVKHGI